MTCQTEVISKVHLWKLNVGGDNINNVTAMELKQLQPVPQMITDDTLWG